MAESVLVTTIQAMPIAPEHVVLLDAHGQPCGTAPKSTVHGPDTPLHLAFSCHLLRADGSVLLTRRADTKTTWPGVWSNACCGHPQPGEELRAAVCRRVGQELGARPLRLSVELPDFAYRAEMTDGTVEHELCPVLVAELADGLQPDPREVGDFTWVPWGALLERADASPESLSPWSVLQLRELDAAGFSPDAWLRDHRRRSHRTTDWRSTPETDAPAAIDPHEPVTGPVTELLRDHLRTTAHSLSCLDPRLAEVTTEIEALVDAGGKRLRPAFVYWGFRSTGMGHEARVLPAAAAVELLHTFALLHDDVMDRSAQRRGRPTAHRAFAEHHAAEGWRGDAGWFGVSAAVLAGDLAFVGADDLIDTLDASPEAVRRARAVFGELRREVMAGQYLDLVLAADATSGEQAARDVAVLKSARYTVTRPLLLGACLADDAPAPTITDALTRYGDAIGLAFQLRDDVLGLFGDPTATGKGAIDDVREGKRTMLVLRALRLAPPAARARLEHALGNPDLDEDDLDAVRDIVTRSGALASVEALIESQHTLGLTATTDLPEPARSALRTLAGGAARRDS